jgi:nucleotide-binding universal stress UspA family protein
VAEAVVAASPVPVLIQRAWQPLFGQPLGDQPKILVPLDGSPFAESALAPAARLAEDLRGHLVLLSMQEDPISIRTAAEYLSALQTEYSHVPTIVEVRNGNAAQGIVAAVDVLEADLVFMATHGRTGPGRAALGSVAGKLLLDGDAPVILLRPQRVDTADEVPAGAPATAAT